MASSYSSGAVHVFIKYGAQADISKPVPPANGSQNAPGVAWGTTGDLVPNPATSGPIGIPRYFGTCESMPQDSRMPEYDSVMTDTSGVKIPYDVAWQGQSAQISLVMTRVEQDVVEVIQSLPNPISSRPGRWGFSDVGTMMGSEGMALEVWLAYSFGAALGNKPEYTSRRLRPGRHYLQCVLWAPQMEEAGSKPMKQHFMLFAWPRPDKKLRHFTLYDYDFTGITVDMLK